MSMVSTGLCAFAEGTAPQHEVVDVLATTLWAAGQPAQAVGLPQSRVPEVDDQLCLSS